MINFIPQFSQQYINENKGAIASSNYDFIAVSAGSTIFLSYFSNNKIEAICPISFSIYPITSISFHNTEKILSAGDTSGTVYFYDINSRIVISSFKCGKSNNNEDVCGIHCIQDNLLILLKNKRLILINFPTQKEPCKQLWEMLLRYDYNRISVDSQNRNFILFKENSNFFTIYQYFNEQKKPIVKLERIELPNKEGICDAQWSYHLPDSIFFILPSEIYLFHIESQIVFPIISQRLTSSTFNSLLQLPDDFSVFIIILKNGGITVFKSPGNLNFQMIFDKQQSCENGSIVSSCISHLHPRYAFMFHSSLGLGLFDLSKYMIVSYDLFFPSCASSFDSDGTNYAIGTHDGFIISGNVYEPSQIKRYLVTNQPITFVNFDSAISRIYWQAGSHLGFIDIAICHIETYTSKFFSVLRCFGSRHGCLIVQRDLRTLGVFIEGKESPLILSNDIVDLSIDDMTSSTTHGSFSLITKNNEIQFYTFTKSGITRLQKKITHSGIGYEPLCFALNGEMMATGFSNGVIHLFDGKNSSQIQTRLQNLRNLTFSSSNVIIGLARSNTLFSVSESGVNICPFPVVSYKRVDEESILVMTVDKAVKFVLLKNNGWNFASQLTNYLSAPSEAKIIKDYILNPDSLCLSFLAKNAWQCLLNKNNLRLQARFGAGESGQLEKINWELLEMADIDNSDFIRMKVNSLIFSDNFSEAAQILANSPSDTFSDIVFSTLLFQLEKSMTTSKSASNLKNFEKNKNSENNKNAADRSVTIEEKAKARLKSAAISMCEAGMFDEGSLLFRLGRMDKIALNCLIDYGQDEHALRFIRNCPHQDDKKRALFRLGCKMLELHKKEDAISFFASSNEFHTVLFELYKTGLYADSFFLMKYLQFNELLKETPDSLARFLPNALIPLDQLCIEIENQFNSLLEKLKIEQSKVILKKAKKC
ncbi:hypothetical protein M9Y10_002055 [Tritrichomonas musculus]|uniref:Uncharacterized protein n=1 Tax=Tritrichomonas musculus TaxID=1915356 RepID=A0ABR2L9L8_9EUKA